MIFCLTLVIFGPTYSQESGVWEVYTSTAQIRYLDYFNDSLQAATIGGWLKIDIPGQGMNKLTNIDGLGTSNLYFLYRDAYNFEWIAGYGRLVRYRDGQYRPYLFFDRDGALLTLYSLADDGDYVWVATSRGLAWFSKFIDDGQIMDYYFRFGDLNPEPIVYDLALEGDHIVLATSAGLALADRSDPDLLKSYINWTTFNSADDPALAGDTITALALYENELYLGTTRGAFRMEIAGDTNFIRLDTRNPEPVNDLVVAEGALYIFGDNGVYRHISGTTEWQDISSFPTGSRFTTGRAIEDVLWVGVENRGLYYESGGGFVLYEDGGLPGVEVTALSVNGSGLVAGSFGDKDAAYFDDSVWVGTRLPELTPFGVGNTSKDIQVDENGDIWICAQGPGLMFYTNGAVFNYDETNSSLRGVSENASYVFTDALAGGEDYVFISNYRALDGNPVSVVDLADRTNWISFGDEDGISDVFTASLDYFDGVFALGLRDNGVFYYYCGPDPFNKADDSVVHFREDNSFLGSNNVNVVRFDRDGELWAGTKFGLSHFDYGIDRFVNINLPLNFGPTVTALTFDRRNNIWIGARNGLAFYNRTTQEYTIYNILNSGLPDNSITTLAIDPTSGDLWAGTSNGMARYRTFLGTPSATIEEVIAFPNPFIIADGSERLGFNYVGSAMVRIFTPAGEMVREFDINIPWDGKNQKGEEVASGVYLALLTAPDGQVGRARIFLMRP